MSSMTLVIGNKNYSSWSLRPWMLLKQAGLEFEEVRVPLSQDDTHATLGQYSPSHKVPVLIDGDITVWDSIAICEYISEQHMDGRGWPGDYAARARARTLSAEMHSGFAVLRSEWPMNCRLQKQLPVSGDLKRDIERIDDIWSDCRAAYGERGPWLFGDFSIADCMYAPVALRFRSYAPDLSKSARKYLKTALGNEHLQEWSAAGSQETEIIPEDEVDGE